MIVAAAVRASIPRKLSKAGNPNIEVRNKSEGQNSKQEKRAQFASFWAFEF
jgi:hypothetical protein